MDTPTPLQAHLLKAVQNLAYDNQQRLAHARHAGHASPPPEVLQQLRIGEGSREQLEDVALAVGVPKPWVDYVRAAGERGGQWQPGQALLGSGQVDRTALTDALGIEVRGLQDMAGVAAAYTRRGELNRDAVARFRRVMGMTWQRLGAVSYALTLSEEERHQIWQRGAQHWSTAVAAKFATHSDQQLAARWNQVAGTDFTAITMPVIVLQTAGITHDDITTQMPISPDHMVSLAADALTTLDRRSAQLTVTDPDRDPDAAGINAAIEAAGLTGDPPAALEPADTTTDPTPASAVAEVDHGHEP
ncbi:hypothetical protein OIE68_16995 [Nocardia vinacea]|uniref:hypothetical protein n=1 Tax=Nocardia vinacea TaxID=96468 RepID=UPI002E10067F|nr:hypothetical protein OIE68_16995 [Nocardia vinacea]